ncbi:hypothetical protein [Burkholderia sp. Bp8984]|uniref:hypothetical protein n=1 Tax=Burkholderia sp. Bp8984 TaxID=2184549 RepID=UPI000F5AD0DC|nr:hypothetical protein [Burkholderia sp. Bp8984]RQS63843.1 hypothetical protein DID98_02880 [Burkholderia sp. Bp8984]
MAFPSTTNVDGSNPGPNVSNTPDTTQSPIGNVQKIGRFAISLTPAAVATISAPIQNFANTGIGLLTTDSVVVTPPGATAGVAQASAWVSAADQLSIQFVNPTAGSLTPPAGTYLVDVFRVQPNWTAPASGNQMDW